MMPMRVLSGTWTRPRKRVSSPATMRSSVVLPQPDGPISTVMLCGRTSSRRSRMAGIRVPSTPIWVFSSMRISNWLVAPAGRASFKGLHQQIFDCEHDGYKGDGVAENGRHVEELEVEVELKAHPVWPTEQLDHQNNLPDQGDTRSRGGREIGLKLWQGDIAQLAPERQAVSARHLLEPRVESARALAHGDNGIRDLVQRDGADRRCLVQPEPDIGKNDDD